MSLEPTEKKAAVHRTAPAALTTAAIKGLKPGTMRADGSVRPGYGSLKARRRQTPSGRGVTEFLFVYQHAGKKRTQTLGRFNATEAEGLLTLSQARVEAARLQALIRDGEDPLAEREIDRQQAKMLQAAMIVQVRQAETSTLSALCDNYVDHLRETGKEGSAYDVGNLFANHVKKAFPDLATLPASAITPHHVAHILSRLVGPNVKDKDRNAKCGADGEKLKKGRTALKLRSYLSTAFRHELGKALEPTAATGAPGFNLTMNPVASVPSTTMARHYNVASTRKLSQKELRAYLAHVSALPFALTRIALMLQIASGGQRIQQLLRIAHQSMHEGETLTLHDPKGRRAKARAHVLPIVPEIKALLDELAAINPEGKLFASRDAVLRPETLSSAVKAISDLMVANGESSQPFRGGDIRRTVETMMAGAPLNISKDVRAQLLSHGLSGIQDKHYDVGEHLEAKKKALRRWNDFVGRLRAGSSGMTTGNVHQLPVAIAA
ncbi:tyrosine-type recombinase/integrase [Variovorax sp. LT2P21]